MKLNSRFLFLLFFSVKIVLISDRSITRLFWRFNYHHFFRVSFFLALTGFPSPHLPKEKKLFLYHIQFVIFRATKPTILRFFLFISLSFQPLVLYMRTSVLWARSFPIAKFRSFYSFKKIQQYLTGEAKTSRNTAHCG